MEQAAQRQRPNLAISGTFRHRQAGQKGPAMNRLNEHGGSNGEAQAAEQLPAVAPSLNGHDGADRGDGRTTRGRFAKGNAGGPGNPFARQLGRIRSALISGVSDADIQGVAAKLVRMVTEDGNLEAARLLLSYAVGPPLEKAIDPDRLDLNELQLLRDHPRDGTHPTTPADVVIVMERGRQAYSAIDDVAYQLDGEYGPHIVAALKEHGLEELVRAAQAHWKQIQAEEAAQEKGGA
jgi:hypothetical protein